MSSCIFSLGTCWIKPPRQAPCLATLLATLIGLIPGIVNSQQPAAVPGAPAYHLESKWKPGGEGSCESLTLDSQTHRLYVARADCVQIIDTERGTLIRAIPGLEGGRGIALAPDFNCGFAASSESDTVVTFNLTSLRPQGAPIGVGRKPGAIVYEPLSRHVFVFNAASNDASVIDPAKGAVIARIPLGGAPASATTDGNGALYVNLKDKNEVLTLDAQKNAVIHHWSLAPGAGPMGLAFDPIKHRLFVGCRNGQLIVLDPQTGKHLAELPIGRGENVCTYDPGVGQAFASSGDGTLTVVQEDPVKPGTFQALETFKTQEGARAMALDLRTHALYLAAPEPAADSASEGFALLKFTR